MFPQTPRELIARLRENPNVIGILCYGSRTPFEAGVGGDIDLFVIVNERPDGLESLHFHVGQIPVDLNVRTLVDLELQPPLTEIDPAILDATVIFDRDGIVSMTLTQLQEPPPAPLTENEIAWHRFCQQHLIDKVEGRLESEPTLCALLLNINIYWLIQTDFRVRLLRYKGEKAALNWLRQNAPEIYRLIERFYTTPDLPEKLSITKHLTEQVLAPIGGAWKRDELIPFGTTDSVTDLNEKGAAFFRALIPDSVGDG